MIGRILPAAVAVAACTSDRTDAALFPEEEAVVRNAVEKRRREFSTGRWCARQAMVRLGLPETAIPSGSKRQPLWPHGLVGSITHCAGYRAAAVAKRETSASIGIDAEPHETLPDGVLRAIALPTERAAIARMAATNATVHWDRLLFSAKECVYKTWFPLTEGWLGFADAEIDFDASRGTFAAQLLVDGPLAEVTGRWLVTDGLVLTALAVPGTAR